MITLGGVEFHGALKRLGVSKWQLECGGIPILFSTEALYTQKRFRKTLLRHGVTMDEVSSQEFLHAMKHLYQDQSSTS